jgi:hypothetical protein
MPLARQREDAAIEVLAGLVLENPGTLLRQLRTDLHELLVDRGKIQHTNERIVHLETIGGGLSELVCENLKLSSGARLEFRIQLEQDQRGWLLRQFRFHVHLPRQRDIGMVRIHLKPDTWHDPLAVPRCHLHVDNSQAHVPFPIMNPRLILHLICERIEPDFGT